MVWMECSLRMLVVVLVHLVNLPSIISMEMVNLVLGAHLEKLVMRIIIKHHEGMRIIPRQAAPQLRLLNKVYKAYQLEVERFQDKISKLRPISRLSQKQKSQEK